MKKTYQKNLSRIISIFLVINIFLSQLNTEIFRIFAATAGLDDIEFVNYVATIYDVNGNLLFENDIQSNSQEITADVESGSIITYNIKISNTTGTDIELDSSNGYFSTTLSGFVNNYGDIQIKILDSAGATIRY